MIGTLKPGRVLPDLDQTGQPCWTCSVNVNGMDEILPFQFKSASKAKATMRRIVEVVNENKARS